MSLCWAQVRQRSCPLLWSPLSPRGALDMGAPRGCFSPSLLLTDEQYRSDRVYSLWVISPSFLYFNLLLLFSRSLAMAANRV